MKSFVDLGTRNKGTFWEFVSAFSFLNTKLPITQYNIPTFFGFGEGAPNKHCHHVGVIENTKRLIIQEFKQGLYTKDFFERLDAVYSKPLVEIKDLVKQDFSNDSNEVLAEKIDFITKSLAESHKPMLLALKSQFVDDFFKQELLKILSDKEKENVVGITSLLLTPTRLTFVQSEEQSLFELQQINEESLSFLAEKFGWFHMEYMQEPWGVSDYRCYLSDNSITISPKQKIAEAKVAQQEFFNNHPNSDSLRQLSFALREFSMILDSSKAMVIQGSFLARPLFTHIANKIGLSWRDMLYLVLPEITGLLKNNRLADKHLIGQRKESRAVLLKDNQITFYQGEQAKNLASNLIQQPDLTQSTEVKGVVGYQGKVRGRVTVIKSIWDKAKFTKGDILVTHDGTAELTLFLKQASAIVTDQGGMISHAAIVAREMQTPCVLGTNIATKIFKDGDLVEVDAVNGVVRKIS